MSLVYGGRRSLRDVREDVEYSTPLAVANSPCTFFQDHVPHSAANSALHTQCSQEVYTGAVNLGKKGSGG